MMDNFKQKFIEEAEEHILTLEETLLELENNPGDMSLVEKVFRAMHSLKGGGAMFGFEMISSFTHDLENIYDLVRNNEMNVSKELLDVTFLAVDHLKNLIAQAENITDDTKANHQQLLEKINEFNTEKTSNTKSTQENVSGAQDKKAEKENSTFYIHFIPNEDIMDNGTNPFYLVDELNDIGKCEVYINESKIPPFEDIDISKCYLSWEIIMSSDVTVNEINDVFIFVEDDCQLEIQQVSDHDLLKSKAFKRKLKKAAEESEDIGIHKLHNIIREVENSVASKVKKALNNDKAVTKNSTSISSIRVSSDKLDRLMNLVSELVTTQARLSLFAEADASSELTSISENIQKLSRELRDIAFSIVLIPIETILTRFQRLVRDLSAEQKKDVVFKAEGTDTELDKTIIENLTDPILHILRNSIDHGIESPEERQKAGKPAQGKILLKAFYSGPNVHIQIIDDGRGLSKDKILQKAIDKGLIQPETQLSDKEIFDLIFLPGFSTAINVTDISGRGVGMDVVKRKISEIRGEVDIYSEPGVGTTITIRLPLTLSIIDGLLVRVHDTNYIIPLPAVHKIYAVEHQKLIKAFNNTLLLDNQQIPFFRLREEFTVKASSQEIEQLVVIKYDDQIVGLAVDEVIGEYQAVLKPLGKMYKNQEIISGASILGDGTIALVLDSNKAIKYFSNKIDQIGNQEQ